MLQAICKQVFGDIEEDYVKDNKHPLFKAVENVGLFIFIPRKQKMMSYEH